MIEERGFLAGLAAILKVANLDSLDPDADLFELGLLDSFGIVELAELMEKHSTQSLEVNLEDLVNINSLTKIRSIVGLDKD